MSTITTTTTKIFLAYSRKDSEFLDELKTHMTPLERSGEITIWYDGKIEPGSTWEAEIKNRLHSANIILLLVSANSIASDYFYEQEMKDALLRHDNGSAQVVPFILRPCAWKATPLAKLQAIPKNGRAVTAWKDRDEAYSDAVTQLWNLVNLANSISLKEGKRENDSNKENKIIEIKNDGAKSVLQVDESKEEIIRRYIVPGVKLSLFISYLILGIIPWIAFKAGIYFYIANVILVISLFFLNKNSNTDKYLVILSVALFAIISILYLLTDLNVLNENFPLDIFASIVYFFPVAFMVRIFMKNKKL